MLAAELTTAHEVGLIIVAALFIAFALISSFLAPRLKPDYPGPNGMSVFMLACFALFGLMLAAINFFG